MSVRAEKRPRILVVEDDPDLAKLLVWRLEAQGWDVVSVGDGYAALREIQDVYQDLLVLDVMLPGINGWALCRWIRQHPDPRIAQVSILMLTARNAPEERVRGLQLGADDYLGKPFSLRELALRIRRLLESRRRATRYLRLRSSLFDLVRVAQREARNQVLAGEGREKFTQG
jgi:DNA-binding response OmpR family regulator